MADVIDLGRWATAAAESLGLNIHMQDQMRQYTGYSRVHSGILNTWCEEVFLRNARAYARLHGLFLPKSLGSKILDAGCGTGSFLYYLKQQGYRDYYGIDLCADSIDFVRRHITTQCEQGDMVDYLRANPDSHDAIVMNDWLRGIAQWVAERKEGLAEFFGLAKPQAPCYTTYARILGRAVVIDEFEQVVHDFFAALPGAGHTIEIALDGKTLRGTIPLGQTRGVHLLAAYFPGEGLVFMQVEVECRENEIVAAPRVLKGLDLQGKIITGDAMLTQRKLSVQIVEAGGEYVFPVKENQPQLLEDIQTLFTPEKCVKGFSPATKDFRTAEKTEKGHGRIEQRTLTVSSELKGYVDWPYAEQVFKLERAFEQMNTGKRTQEVVYGITSLSAKEAGAERLLEIVRRHWGIESGLHYRRDVTLREDRSRVRTGHAPHALAVINNLVLGLFARLGYTSAPEARRHFAAHLDESVNLILQAQR